MVFVSIVIPVHNGVQHTKKCIESIENNTPKGKYEIIVIDNASTDETQRYLAESNIQNIRNDTNFGFTKAINQGIRQAKGKYIFILHNDAILFSGWLARMLEGFDKDVGAVGPTSNLAIGKQQVKVARRSATPQQIHNIVSIQRKGQTEEAELLVSFALMIPKDVINEVGLFDERYFAKSEDYDYSLRLREAGYKLNIALDVFVYHKGSVTSKYILDQYNKFEMQGLNAFCSKWTKELGIDIQSHRQAFEAVLGRKQPSITIAAIVKNEGRLMRNMIKTASTFCDDFCIVDTGSTDKTIQLLKPLLLNNGILLTCQWNDNFSESRNFGLRHCKGKWILQLDADEVIDKRYASTIRKMAEQDQYDAFRFVVINFRESPFLIEDPKTDKITSIRMWKNDRNITYRGVIHETVAESISQADFRVGEAPVPIYHFAYLKSPARHFELTKKAATIEPDRGNTHYFLGEQYLMQGKLDVAISCFHNAIAATVTKRGEGAYTKKVKQMLEITQAVKEGRDLQRYPKEAIEHFKFLTKENRDS